MVDSSQLTDIDCGNLPPYATIIISAFVWHRVFQRS
jgi:hypothetical protein